VAPPVEMRETKIDPLTGEDEMSSRPSIRAGQPFLSRPDLPVDPNNPATWGKVQRNAPCPCGSGRKFKHCHGALV
jgi:preprotein translocase subunit SecA